MLLAALDRDELKLSALVLSSRDDRLMSVGDAHLIKYGLTLPGRCSYLVSVASLPSSQVANYLRKLQAKGQASSVSARRGSGGF